jgi:hypothetical protein
MEERRKVKRKYLMFYSRVFDRNSGKLLGYLSDLTQDGAMVISEDPIETGLVMRLCMDLPEGYFTRERLNFEAKSVWCKPDIDPKFYNTGFQLINPNREDIDIIQWIIQEYGFRD